jgi:hypothetical protein
MYNKVLKQYLIATMSGYNLIRKIRYLEEECHKLGFQMCHAKHYYQEFGDVLALKPRDDCFPVYSRDAELFIGTITELERWIQGFQFARKYDSMIIGKKHDSLRDRKEKDYRNKSLLNIIKDGKNEQMQRPV